MRTNRWFVIGNGKQGGGKVFSRTKQRDIQILLTKYHISCFSESVFTSENLARPHEYNFRKVMF